MVWLPTPLKGFTDTIPEVKSILRVCAFHLYGWVCGHPSVAGEAKRVRSGAIPEGYPKSWPTPERPSVVPLGTAPFNDRVARQIAKRKLKFKADIENLSLTHYPRIEVLEVLKFWGIELE
jgi:hypothetical protein